MKKSSPKQTASRPEKSKQPQAENKSAAAKHLGGQPENDADARAAGFESATADAPAKPQKPRTTKSAVR